MTSLTQEFSNSVLHPEIWLKRSFMWESSVTEFPKMSKAETINVDDKPAVANEIKEPTAWQDTVVPGEEKTFKFDVNPQLSTKNAEDGMAENAEPPSSCHENVSPDNNDPAKCV